MAQRLMDISRHQAEHHCRVFEEDKFADPQGSFNYVIDAIDTLTPKGNPAG
jgi:tRNA A37 threonylcarbamoyladenosine dehydratase